ncbi:dermonecrotic toxin domain-containing protein [Arsenophonus nasoniae]|uniref:dermonecrotic toxin domain-containing protein n=1 Tax=Arsenophonus nasoniae TaxID=638 RepID=UPI0038793957
MTSNNNNKSDKKNYEPILYIINNAEEKDFNDKNGGSTTRARRDIGIQDITGIFQEKKEISIYDFIALAIKEIGKFTLDYIVSNLQEGDQFKETFKPINELLNIQKSVNDSFPDLHALAKELIKKAIKEKKNIDIDPDKTYVHYFGLNDRARGADESKETYTGYFHKESRECWTLTEFLFRGFKAKSQDAPDDVINFTYGVYRDGPGATIYNQDNEVKIKPVELKDIINEIDFYSKVTTQYNDFWQNHKEDACTLARTNFVISAKKALYNGVFSYNDYEMVMKNAAPNVPLNDAINDLSTLKLNAIPIKSNVSIYLIDINGYNSVDILRFVDDKGKTIVYCPNENQPFRVFNDDTTMRKWIAEQGKDDDKRLRFSQHFSLYNNQDGVPIVGKTGVYNGLKKLGSGDRDHMESYINKNNTIISNDVFQTVTENLQKRLDADADTLIKSNSETLKEIWISRLGIASEFIFPIMLTIDAPAIAVGGFIGMASEIGLRIDKAIEGDTEEERNEAATGLAIDLGFVLLFGVLSKLPKLKFKFLNVKFNSPKRINGKIGYILSPNPRKINKMLGDSLKFDKYKEWNSQIIAIKKKEYIEASEVSGIYFDIIEEKNEAKCSILINSLNNIKFILIK